MLAYLLSLDLSLSLSLSLYLSLPFLSLPKQPLLGMLLIRYGQQEHR